MPLLGLSLHFNVAQCRAEADVAEDRGAHLGPPLTSLLSAGAGFVPRHCSVPGLSHRPHARHSSRVQCRVLFLLFCLTFFFFSPRNHQYFIVCNLGLALYGKGRGIWRGSHCACAWDIDGLAVPFPMLKPAPCHLKGHSGVGTFLTAPLQCFVLEGEIPQARASMGS